MSRPPLPVLDRDDAHLVWAEPHLADAIFRQVQNNRVALRPWMTWVDGTHSSADVRAFLERSERELADGVGAQTVLVVGDEVAGVLGCHTHRPAHRTVELGYWIARAHQGRGLVTQTVLALRAWAVENWGVHRVEIRCSTENRRSRAVAERAGFRLDGVLRDGFWIGDSVHDLCVYGWVADAA